MTDYAIKEQNKINNIARQERSILVIKKSLLNKKYQDTSQETWAAEELLFLNVLLLKDFLAEHVGLFW